MWHIQPEESSRRVSRGVKFGCKRKTIPEQIDHARARIERGKRCEDVAALFKVERATLYQVLSNEP